MDALINELGLSEKELDRRNALIKISNSELAALRECVVYAPPASYFENIVNQVIEITSANPNVSANTTSRLKNEIYRYINTYLNSESRSEYLRNRVELCTALMEMNISNYDFLLCMHEFHVELAQKLKIALKEHNIVPCNIVMSLMKFNSLDNQLINQISHSVHIRDVNDQMKGLNFKDYLTNTYSLTPFIEELERTIAISERASHTFTVLHIDFNELKQVNQRFGYSAGDDLLKLFADICVEQLRKTEIIARDDDEFFILMPNTPIENIRPVCERIVDQFEETAMYPINVRVAAYSYQPTDTVSPEDILKALEDKLTHAKERSLITDTHEFNLAEVKAQSNVIRLIK
ncbi:GGDEF domain-containing protein [Vibrio makurazakiensis]|uniref:GGDEF domain-containing protein n=1 Tax=Vibrio makurazakiensis TaxID=2910250 RepID=UPI003D132BE5